MQCVQIHCLNSALRAKEPLEHPFDISATAELRHRNCLEFKTKSKTYHCGTVQILKEKPIQLSHLQIPFSFTNIN